MCKLFFHSRNAFDEFLRLVLILVTLATTLQVSFYGDLDASSCFINCIGFSSQRCLAALAAIWFQLDFASGFSCWDYNQWHNTTLWFWFSYFLWICRFRPISFMIFVHFSCFSASSLGYSGIRLMTLRGKSKINAFLRT